MLLYGSNCAIHVLPGACLALLWRMRMRTTTMISLSGLLLLMGSFGLAQQQQHDDDACKFSVQGDPVHATVTGPEDILPLVYVIEQPDSPVEVVSVDLEGMW